MLNKLACIVSSINDTHSCLQRRTSATYIYIYIAKKDVFREKKKKKKKKGRTAGHG
jgi:hypothetical protein